jgi:hypothetical protein
MPAVGNRASLTEIGSREQRLRCSVICRKVCRSTSPAV